MRTKFNHMAKAVKNKLTCIHHKVQEKYYFLFVGLQDDSGEGYIDTGVKILICVVLGGLLLTGLYALFGDTVLPTLKERIEGMFNYAG